MMDGTTLHALLPAVCALAREAGARVLEIYESRAFEVEKKGDGTPVTTADRAADEIIISGLRQLTPAIPVVTEETVAAIPFEQRRGWATCWLVDPVDGTREFIERTGEFSVNIALVVEGAPVLGVVYGPAVGQLYFGGPKLGAWKQAGEAPQQAIRVRAAETGCRLAVSRRHGRKVDALKQMLPQPVTEVHMGSALKTCLVAEGRADFYPRMGETSHWDTAAGHAILKAAGGEMMDLTGKPLRYQPTERLLNPFFIAVGASPLPDEAQGRLAQLASS